MVSKTDDGPQGAWSNGTLSWITPTSPSLNTTGGALSSPTTTASINIETKWGDVFECAPQIVQYVLTVFQTIEEKRNATCITI
jgi:hypothetical protein